ncbi:protein of unknown function [Ruminococcaceae bacterium BL-6]|nr:protein of unknown function [Ruminococcaceae bacterium BL-6]
MNMQENIKDVFSKVLTITGYGIGEVIVDGEIGTKGEYLDAYLLAIVLKEFIENGDIEIKLTNKLKSKSNRIDYLKRLLESIKELRITDD